MSKKILSDQEVACLIDEGHALEAAGRLDEAMKCYLDAIPLAPNPARAHLNHGNVLLLKGDLNGALNAFRTALRHNPDYAGAYYNMGNALLNDGKLDDAMANYRRALEIQPDYAEVHCSLGVALKALGQPDLAIACFQTALKINPGLDEAHYNLGNALRELGQLESAVACFRRVVELKPDFAEAYYNLGNTLKAVKQLDTAEASYRQALQIKPDYAEAYCDLGIVLHVQGRLDEAEACYRHALQIKPDASELYGNLGSILKKQGRADEALACFQQQLRLTPENEVTPHHIASLTGMNTERAPTQYVKEVFDNYADKFDTHLRQVLKYETPEKLVTLITQRSKVPFEKWRVLDLGCGTGLVGLAIAPFSQQLIGVDLSPRMLEKADARKLYQRLECMDLLAMMRNETTSFYDVIIAADVFIYLGKLDEIISEIKRLLCPGGFFAFSIETHKILSNEDANEGVERGYQLENTGRYTHSSDYITKLACANDFLPQTMEVAQLRMENYRPVDGLLVLWKN